MSKEAIEYFRADAHLIGKLLSIDSLRYTSRNIAVLNVVVSIPGKRLDAVVVSIEGDYAETLAKSDCINRWFEVKGQLFDSSPAFDGYELANLSIVKASLKELPDLSEGLFFCEIIGRLTEEPESVTKTNDFSFSRFSMAVNRTEYRKASFFNVSIFRAYLIDSVKYFKKGDTVFVSGDISTFKSGENQNLTYSVKLDKFLCFR